MKVKREAFERNSLLRARIVSAFGMALRFYGFLVWVYLGFCRVWGLAFGDVYILALVWVLILLFFVRLFLSFWDRLLGKCAGSNLKKSENCQNQAYCGKITWFLQIYTSSLLISPLCAHAYATHPRKNKGRHLLQANYSSRSQSLLPHPQAHF